MGAREKLFRKKIADQLDKLIVETDIVYTAEAISGEKLDDMIRETHQLLDRLTVYKFFHDLPENDAFVLEFLELEEQEKKQETSYEPDTEPDIPKIIDTIEEVIAEDAELVENGDNANEPSVEPEPEASEEQVRKEGAAKDNSLEEKLRSQPIRSLLDSIALNDRFLFSNELFGGSMEAFNKALRELDHIASLDDARKFIEMRLKTDFKWDESSETVINFISLVERRFK